MLNPVSSPRLFPRPCQFDRIQLSVWRPAGESSSSKPMFRRDMTVRPALGELLDEAPRYSRYDRFPRKSRCGLNDIS